jgi:transcription elongation factor GreA
MAESEQYLTPDGAQRIRAELDELRGNRRAELARRLRHAVQQGDLSENADYIAAKEEQAFLEGRILELETLLKRAVIVELQSGTGVAQIGSTVLVSVAGGEPERFQLVGAREASPRDGRISHESPIGQALLGRRTGESVTAQSPGGPLELRILDIL